MQPMYRQRRRLAGEHLHRPAQRSFLTARQRRGRSPSGWRLGHHLLVTATAPEGVDAGRAIPTEARRGDRVRLRSIDAFRGAVLAFMVLTPATGDPAIYPFLRHAPWDGATASDLVLPTFLVTSGLSLAFLLRPPVHRRKVLRLVRRVVLLVLLGLAYNAYGATGLDLGELRYTGVLQMIGVSGFLAAAAVLVTRRNGQDRPVLIGGVILALVTIHGIGLAMLADRCAGAEACSPYATWDRQLLGASHTYGAGSPGYDPEGLASTVVATVLVLCGYLAGRRLVAATPRTLPVVAATIAATGVAFLGAAWFLDRLDPANKRLLTPAFLALAAGSALIGVSIFVAALDAWGPGSTRPAARAPAFPLVGLGRNALIVYLTERFLLQTASMVHIGDRSVRRAVLDALPAGATTKHLAYTASLLAIITAITSVMHWRNRYLAL